MSAHTGLQGKRVVVTRPGHQSESLSRELKILGANPIELPVITVRPANDRQAINEAIKQLDSFDWVIFSSVNGVQFFLEAINNNDDLSKLKACRLAAIGPATADALEQRLRKADAMPAEFISDAISSVLGDVKGKKILLARAKQARKVLAEDLKNKGAIVSELALYDVEINRDPALESLVATLERPDFFTFTSSSTVRGMHELLKKCDKDWLQSVPAICIGPITAQTLKDYGVEPYKVASVYTVKGILEIMSN